MIELVEYFYRVMKRNDHCNDDDLDLDHGNHDIDRCISVVKKLVENNVDDYYHFHIDRHNFVDGNNRPSLRNHVIDIVTKTMSNDDDTVLD